MYKKIVPFVGFDNKPKNITVHFNLMEREVFKLLSEFKAIFDWQERIDKTELTDLPTEEVVEFYNNLEEILLSAYGTPSDDGIHFEKSDRYKFEESLTFNECMKMFVADPSEANKLIDGLMPKGLQDMVKKAEGNLKELGELEGTPDEIKRQIEALQSQLPAES